VVIAFIPARCGSKSIPLKNIKLFCGKPLIYWNLKALQDSRVVERVFVATDCDEIEKEVIGFGFAKAEVYRRDTVNAVDDSSSESVVLEFIGKHNFAKEDLFVLVQATSPFTQAEDFDKAVAKYKDEQTDSLLTCVKSKRFFWDNNSQPINYDLSMRPRRQNFDGLLMENGAFYISTVGLIEKNKNRLSGKIVIYEMPEFTSVELDEDHDWGVAESLMRKHVLSKKQNNSKIKLFVSDVDGTLTDGGMYYDQHGNELKKFNTRDGKGFELLRKCGIKTGIITSENTSIVEFRAKKLKVDYLYQGVEHQEKLKRVKELCLKEGITMEEVAYIGDDINCRELLEAAGLAACPKNAVSEIKSISGIVHLNKAGGDGVVREFIDMLLRGFSRN
jgi:YrbI family 3-deoxy-D-manno-octulosonate 8-phosphate phosphatase